MNIESLSGVTVGFLAGVATCAVSAFAAAGGGSLPQNCPASGNCDTEHAWPGCNSAACCTEVCSFDPFCCESQWDGVCAGEATTVCTLSVQGLCGGLAVPFYESCFEVHSTPACSNLVCCEMVSVIDPFCLDVQWDSFCVAAANAVCICDANVCPTYRISFGETPGDGGVVLDCSGGPIALDTQFVASKGIVFGMATSPVFSPGGLPAPTQIASRGGSCPDECRSQSPVWFGYPDGTWQCEFRLPSASGLPATTLAGVTNFSADVGFLEVPVTMVGYSLGGSVIASATTNEFGTVRLTLNAPPGELIVHVKVSQEDRTISVDCLSYDGPFDAAPNCPNYTHSCFEEGSAGCDDNACCVAACMQDPFCCLTAWDVNCVTWAVTECGECETKACAICVGGSTAECCELSAPAQPGCKDAECCVTVCAQDAFCCATAWDQLCVDAALALCPFCAGGSDDCQTPTPIEGLGEFPFITLTATTDGYPAPLCNAFDSDDIEGDIWFCWTAPLSGQVLISTCGSSDFDTKIAVYEGCGGPCPIDPLACNDDAGCGGYASRLVLEVQEALTYRIRVGGYLGDRGTGTLSISYPCGGGGAADCCIPGPVGVPGCAIEDCCTTVCFADSFCCTSSWDQLCAAAAALLPECGCDGRTGCDGATGSCTQIHPTPGCSDADCCASVCAIEPSCCDSGWDWFCAEAALGACAAPGCGSPFVVGATAAVHSAVTDPMQIALGADAALFTGRDAIGSGGSNSTPVKIHRAPPGGGPASEFGAVVIPDPDAVVVDVDGTLSGTPGSVLVGGQTDASGNTGQILAVRPDQSVVTVFASSTLWKDPQDMVFDGPNLLVADRIRREVRRWMPGQSTLSLLVDDLPENPTHIAVDQAGRIFVSLLDGSIRRYNPNGSGEFVVASGLPPQTPIAVGPTGPWQAGDVYAIVGEDLVRFDGESGGPPVAVGCGFTGTTRDLAFGPDGALYVSRFGNDHVMRFERPTLGAVLGDLDCNGLATIADVAILCAAVDDPAGYALDHPDCSLWATGDIDGDNAITAQDVTALCTLLAEPACGCSPPGDLDGDGDVDGADLATLLGAWGSAGPLGDLNGDSTVDAADLAILLGGWGS